MDIFKQAKETPNADYYDMYTGRTYHIADWTRSKKMGLSTKGIAVSENGNIIGYVEEPIEED